MNTDVLYYTLLIGFTILGIFKNSLSLNPIRFHCNNYVLNTYLYFILSWGIMMATTTTLKNLDVKLNDLFSGPFTILLALSSICLLVGLLFVPPELFFTKHVLYIAEMMLLGITLYPYFVKNKSLFYHIAITTLSVLVVLSLITFYAPHIVKDSWFIYLFIALIGVLIARIVELVMTYKNKKRPKFSRWISYISILLFSLFIMYDTKKVLVNADKCVNPDYINESINLVLDSLNLFASLYDVNRE
jgi:FtsH-binding integral membrane protein